MEAENEKRGEVMGAANGCEKPLETEMFTRGILLNRDDLALLYGDGEVARNVLDVVVRWYLGLDYEEPPEGLPRSFFNGFRKKHLREAAKYKQRLDARASAEKKHSRKKVNEFGRGDF